MIKTKIPAPKTTAIAFGLSFPEPLGIRVKGDVFAVLQHSDGSEEVVLDKSNIYTLDGGVLAALLFSGDSRSRPIDMLAVGTGASGNAQAPDVADNRQRRLQVPLYRKAFSEPIYRTPTGEISQDESNTPVPTNIVDFTTTFEASEAVGALTEMGLMSTSDGVEGSVFNPVQEDGSDVVFPSRDTSVILTDYDILANYLTFPVINKPNGSVLAITWRLTF